MKKFAAMLLMIAALALCAANSEVMGIIGNELRDGSYSCHIPIAGGDDGAWRATILSGEDVVKLSGERVQNDWFQAQFAPIADGRATVAAQHFAGIACDRAITWELTVTDGTVKNIRFISDVEGPSFDVTGEWREAETQFTVMSIAPNPERGWDVEIVSPLTHDAFIFRATAFYDCALNAFVYDDGAFYEVPISDEENPVPGAPVTVGTAGNITFDDAVRLTWQDSARGDERIIFEKNF